MIVLLEHLVEKCVHVLLECLLWLITMNVITSYVNTLPPNL